MFCVGNKLSYLFINICPATPIFNTVQTHGFNFVYVFVYLLWSLTMLQPVLTQNSWNTKPALLIHQISLFDLLNTVR